MKKKLISAIAVVFMLAAPTLLPALDSEEGTEKTTISVNGMTCGGCVGAVQVQLKRTAGVKDYEVSLDKEEAVVSYDPTETTPEKIAASITEAGFKSTVKGSDKKT